MHTNHIVIDARIRRSSTGRPVEKLLEYLQALDKTNRYTVLVEPDDEWKPSNKKFTPVVCRFSQFSFNPINQVLFAWQIYKLRPSLVHFTMTGQQPLFYFGKQTTFTHDLTMFKFARAGRLPKWLHSIRMQGLRLLVWAGHRKATKIIVPTEYVRDAVAKYHLFTNRKIVVTLESSEPPVQAAPEMPLVLKSNPSLSLPLSYVLYVGSAFPHKNLKRLVEAFELIKLKNPDIKLIFAGKLEYHAKKLRSWSKKSPHSEEIIFTGFAKENELKWLYENAAVYVFPSLSEGFGLPGLEAMAHGCPVVSSNATCLPEVYGDAALYFNPEDVEDMAAKINKVLSNAKLREELITKGYRQVKKYSWEKMAKQTLEVFQEVL